MGLGLLTPRACVLEVGGKHGARAPKGNQMGAGPPQPPRGRIQPGCGSWFLLLALRKASEPCSDQDGSHPAPHPFVLFGIFFFFPEAKLQCANRQGTERGECKLCGQECRIWPFLKPPVPPLSKTQPAPRSSRRGCPWGVCSLPPPSPGSPSVLWALGFEPKGGVCSYPALPAGLGLGSFR